MSLVESLKRMLSAEERVAYRCDECETTFRVAPGVESPACSRCDSTAVRRINRV